MKHIVLFLITVYQHSLSIVIRNIFGSSVCRFNPTCSEYAKKSIEKYGALRGVYISAKRVISCQPFNI